METYSRFLPCTLIRYIIQNQENNLNHYTYQITYSNGKHYIGVRSCKCMPDKDTKYFGSSKYTKELEVISKEILRIFSTRVLAVNHEIELHELHDVARSPLYLNRSKQTSSKFDTSGIKLKRTVEHNQKIKQALIGRKRSIEECTAISAGKTGKPRKPHSKETIQKMSESRKGTAGYKRGEHFNEEHHTKAYASRTKYSESYIWVHKSGEVIKATCIEMGHRFGSGIKPTKGFRLVVKGVYSSRLGWKLKSQTD